VKHPKTMTFRRISEGVFEAIPDSLNAWPWDYIKYLDRPGAWCQLIMFGDKPLVVECCPPADLPDKVPVR